MATLPATLPFTLGGSEVPVITKPANQTYDLTNAIPTLTLAATNAPTGWEATLAHPLPSELVINAEGEISGKPTATGTTTVGVIAKNASGSSAEVTFTITVVAKLVLEKPAEQTNEQSKPITKKQLGVVKAATGVAPFVYSAVSGFPPGITVLSNGEVEGTPTLAGTFEACKLQVEDAEGVTSAKSFKWVITATTLGLPVVSKPPNQESNKSVAVIPLLPSATNAPTAWKVTGLPALLTASPTTGEMLGTPTAVVGEYTVGLIAENAAGASAEVTFVWKIVKKLELAKPGEQSNEEAKAVSPFQLGVVKAATGVAPYIFSIESGFPPGITVKANGEAQGTPTTAGTYSTATLAVEDAQGVTDKATFTWVITAIAAPKLKKPANQTSKIRATPSLTVVNEGGAASEWELTGEVPPALSINSSGIISGTLTKAGVYSVKATATNAGGSSTVTFTWTVEAGAEERATLTPPKQAPVVNAFSYYAYDFLTGNFMGQIPLRGVQFGQQLNTPGQLTATIDLQDPRVQKTNPLASTIPNRTFIVVDYGGAVMWGGIVMTRKWSVAGSGQSTTRNLEIQCSEMWSYFSQRVQATDYSAPPFSGITGAGEMSLWKKTPWDASLIACQVIEDAVGFTDSATVPYGDPLGGIGIALNGVTPSGSKPAAPEVDYVAVNYPFTSMQTVDTIVTQLSQLGIGVGFDFGVDIAYSEGSASPPVATVNVSYPRRGRTVAENSLMVDLTTARAYEFPEDGTQTANQVYEVGGSGAIVVDQNINPLEQGYAVWERVLSRSNAQSQNIISLLAQSGLSDLALYSYPPVAPSVTIGLFDPNCPLGSFTIGDDVQLLLPSTAPNGEAFDARFPAGLDQEWRITAYSAQIADDGDSTLKLSLNQPPFLRAIAPTV